MGIDLTLIPIDHESDTLNFGYTILQVERRRVLWDSIRRLPHSPLPVNFRTLSEYQFKPVEGGEYCDAYGCALRCVWVHELMKLQDEAEVRDNWQNRAIWAYLGQLPPHFKVVLYWH